MAALRGTVTGARDSQASRLGNSKEPIRLAANTWGREIVVVLRADGAAELEIRSYNGGGTPVRYTLPAGDGPAELVKVGGGS